MAGPWEKYKKQIPTVAVDEEIVEPSTAGKPWLKYAKPVEAEQEAGNVEQGMILPIAKDADGNTVFDSDAGLLGALKRTFMLPGEVMAGEVDPMSEEGLGRVLEFAGTVTPAGAAQRAAGNAIGKQAVEKWAREGGPVKRLLETPKRMVADAVDDPMLARQRLDDFTGIGAEPTAGMINKSPRTLTREQTLATFKQGKPIQERIEGAFSAMDDEFDRIVDGVTTRTNPGAKTNSKQELGRMLRDQAQAAKDAALERSGKLYDDVGKLTHGVPAEGAASKEYLDKLTALKKDLTKSDKINFGRHVDEAIKRTKAIVSDISTGKVEFNKLKQERTQINKLIYEENLDPNARKYLEGLSDALTKDMERTADKASPDALQAFRKANNQYRRFRDNETGFGKKSVFGDVLKEGSDPEKIYQFAVAKSKEGGTRLNALRRQIDRDEGKEVWDNLVGSVVERMGRKDSVDGLSEFNSSHFLKGWKEMSDEAKDALFKGTDRHQYRQDLDRLARVADNLQKYNKARNHSNSQTHGSMASELNPFDRNTLLGAALAGFKGAVIVGSGKAMNALLKRYQAKLLTSPKTVKWLADIPKAEMAKGGLKSHLLDLHRMASQEPPGSALAIAINEYLSDVGYND